MLTQNYSSCHIKKGENNSHFYIYFLLKKEKEKRNSYPLRGKVNLTCIKPPHPHVQLFILPYFHIMTKK